MKGFHDLTHHADVSGTPGLLLYRFGAGIVFYNASYLKKRVLELVAARPDLKWVVIDGSTVNTIDITGAAMIEALALDLARQGVRLGLAAFRTETRLMLERSGAMATIGADSVYPTLKSAMSDFLATRAGPLPGGPDAEDAATDALGERNAE
jgi:sulfate permease, SulP family